MGRSPPLPKRQQESESSRAWWDFVRMVPPGARQESSRLTAEKTLSIKGRLHPLRLESALASRGAPQKNVSGIQTPSRGCLVGA